MDDGDNPMSKAHAAPRCTATSKRTGERCKGPAVRGWRVCRFHGAGGGHSPGKDHPSWRHGMPSQEWIETWRKINELVRGHPWSRCQFKRELGSTRLSRRRNQRLSLITDSERRDGVVFDLIA